MSGMALSHPFLVYFFSDQATGQPDGPYFEAVRNVLGSGFRYGQANYDQAWLDYQYEIGLRRHRGGRTARMG